MANQDDNFLREVEEEIRRERFERLWKEYGTYFIAGAALIVIGVLGYKFVENRRVTGLELMPLAELQRPRLVRAELLTSVDPAAGDLSCRIAYHTFGQVCVDSSNTEAAGSARANYLSGRLQHVS